MRAALFGPKNRFAEIYLSPSNRQDDDRPVNPPTNDPFIVENKSEPFARATTTSDETANNENA
jgi:hypothetical protein